MKNFAITAPGKIILHGEHSVVYNKPAIAGPVSLKTSFNFEETSNERIEFVYKSLDLIVNLSLLKANQFLSELDCNTSLQPFEFLQKIRSSSSDFILKFVEFSPRDRQLNNKEEMAIASTLYMLNRILRAENVKAIDFSFKVAIGSEMSIGAGVGSSASYGVCLASGFFILSQILNGKLNDQKLKEFSFVCNDTILERISLWAFDSEILMHEKPSGIDNTICTYGQLIKFHRGQTPKPIKMNGKVNILLVDTGVTRSTSHVLGKVANFKNKYSSLSDAIFDAMGFLVDDVVTILENNKSENEKFQELSLLVTVNNNLLRAIGVSHPRLEQVFVISESHGFNAKLTGAGVGGCAFVLLPPDYKDSETFQKLCSDLKANNFQIMPTTIEGGGVEYVYKG